MVRVRPDVYVKMKSKDVLSKTDRIRSAWLDSVGKVTVKIAQRSMKPAPTSTKAPSYDTVVNTTFKSGKRKGQKRTFTRRGRYSRPGEPPRVRSKGINLRSMAYAKVQFDEIVIGPVYHPTRGNSRSSFPVPGIHEHGRRVKRTRRFPARPAGFFNVSSPAIGPKTVSETVTYPPRPYMAPALGKAVEYLKRNGERIARRA